MGQDSYFYDLRDYEVRIKQINEHKLIIVYLGNRQIKKFLVRKYNLSIDAGIVNIHKRKWI